MFVRHLGSNWIWILNEHADFRDYPCFNYKNWTETRKSVTGALEDVNTGWRMWLNSYFHFMQKPFTNDETSANSTKKSRFSYKKKLV